MLTQRHPFTQVKYVEHIKRQWQHLKCYFEWLENFQVVNQTVQWLIARVFIVKNDLKLYFFSLEQYSRKSHDNKGDSLSAWFRIVDTYCLHYHCLIM